MDDRSSHQVAVVGALHYAEASHRPRDGCALNSEDGYDADGADVVHGGVGAGLRLRLPPQPNNTLRLDIGYGDTGWGFLLGVQEFFL